MMRKGLFIQERGLMLLIGAAVLVSGFLLWTDLPQPTSVVLPVVIRLDQVHVLLPMFVEQEPVNINQASVDELIVLPGIGPALAQRIIDYRGEHGPFKSVDELEKVSGIGPQTIKDIGDEAVAGTGGL